jgi:alanine racemase
MRKTIKNFKMIRATISKHALYHNLCYLRKKSKAEVMVVLKANAYGHGLIEMAKICRQMNVRYIGVSSIGEALQLRQNGDKGRILAWLYEPSHLKDAVTHHIDIGVFDESHLPILSKLPNSNIHLFVDTGINRNGIPYDRAIHAAKTVLSHPNLKLVGIMSHLCCATDKQKTEHQFDLFRKLKQDLHQLDITPEWFHIANTAGTVYYKHEFNMVRCGDGFYGLIQHPQLKPAIVISSSIVQVKQVEKGQGIGYDQEYTTKRKQYIGIVPVGYADLLPLTKSGDLSVVVNGTKRKVLGVESMDQIVVEANRKDKVGDRVELFGKQQTIQAFTKKSKTVIKEMVTHIGDRVFKEYN